LRVLAVKPGHDGAAAFVDSGRLVYSIEAEKDSGIRHSDVTAELLIDALLSAPELPDVLAIGGWFRVLPNLLVDLASGYRGLEVGALIPARVFGRELMVYSSSHERSHLVGGVAMSPFARETNVAVLIWEGQIGAFYHWRGHGTPTKCFPVLDEPGARYAALFALADPSFPDTGSFPREEYAGKLMALSGYADNLAPTSDTGDVISALLSQRTLYPFHKALFRRSPLYNCGEEAPELHRAARLVTDRVFDLFLTAARECLAQGLPLVVVGGCGLNCEWNSRWRSCGHFSEVFVPPCANDSGSAIGTAVDASVHAGGTLSLEWDVYSGQQFRYDCTPDPAKWHSRPFDVLTVAEAVAAGSVVAWVEGRCEIGPRALGHRSLLASAADARMRDELNRIKQREWYRPIAPVCLESELGRWFDDDRVDEHMLYFRRATHPGVVPAITHVDGTARVQSVSPRSNPRLHELLELHSMRTGAGVLCNTSLNFGGRGFINRLSDLLSYCEQTGIRQIATDSHTLTRVGETTA
jgi:hydroxymethyl cephem carbamoyltransferase